MNIFPKHWGTYPPEYNPAVHGYYYPHRYYGKPDTPFTQVKLGEFGAWLARRDKTPRGVAAALSRGIWKHHVKWFGPKKPGPAGILHVMVWISLFSYMCDYEKLQRHKQFRYH